MKQLSWIKVRRSDSNIGIIRALRFCLEAASGHYILPCDADDLLYPDALGVVTAYIHENNYPALLYTDEDKITDRGVIVSKNSKNTFVENLAQLTNSATTTGLIISSGASASVFNNTIQNNHIGVQVDGGTIARFGAALL